MDVEAYRKRKRDYARTPEQREHRRLYMQTWRENNREKHNAFARAYYQRNKVEVRVKARARHLKNKFGLTSEQYNEMLVAQSGCCAICGKPPTDRHLHVDHDHATGAIRGLLCGSCNGRLGWLEQFRPAITAYLP